MSGFSVGVPYDARDSMQPNRIRNLRSQIAANRYRKSKDEHTATEAYNCLIPDANTRHTKVSDYLHTPLPEVPKKSCRALVASGRNLTIGKDRAYFNSLIRILRKRTSEP